MGTEIHIRGYDYVEFYVGSAKMVAYWYQQAMGFKIVGYKGPENGSKDRCSYIVQGGKAHIVLTSPLHPDCYDVQSFLTLHGDGVKRFAYQVSNVESAYNYAVSHGAVSVMPPKVHSSAEGQYIEAAIRIYDDTEIVLVNSQEFRGILKPGFTAPIQTYQTDYEPTGIQAIDHIVGNVRSNEMNKWAKYFEDTLNFETFIYFGPGDISTQYSALLSKVVRSKDIVIKNPINEPYTGIRKSQIEEYLDQYHGSGVQHIALETKDIIATIRAMRKNGVEFLTVPKEYYTMLREEKKVKIHQDISELEELGILCDTKDVSGGEGYLLQLFTKPIGDRPTFFYEIIQRVGGSQGFGQGNFQSLFEAIERDQAARGNL